MTSSSDLYQHEYPVSAPGEGRPMGTNAKTPKNQHSRRQMTPGERQRLAEKNKKKQKRRLLFVIISALLIFSTLIGGLIYGFFAIFKVTDYTVEGTTVYDAEQVFAISGLAIGKNLFFSDIELAAERIETNLPYIGKAEISRKMPGTIRFVLTETQAAVAIAQGEDFILLDKIGKVLDRTTQLPAEGLPLLRCPPPKTVQVGYILEIDTQDGALASPLEIYKELLAAISSSTIQGITLIDISDTTDVWLTYEARIRMHLGTPKLLENRLVFAAELLKTEDATYPGQKATLDLTILKTAVIKPETED